MKPISYKQETGNTERSVPGRTPRGPAQYEKGGLSSFLRLRSTFRLRPHLSSLRNSCPQASLSFSTGTFLSAGRPHQTLCSCPISFHHSQGAAESRQCFLSVACHFLSSWADRSWPPLCEPGCTRGASGCTQGLCSLCNLASLHSKPL